MYCAKILGIGACSIMYVFLTEVLKYKNVSYNINERADGNGINDKNVEQILEIHKNRKVDLIILGDHGKLLLIANSY